MQTSLTVRDLLLPGEPLDPAQVVAGEGALGNAVTWVVSLRPYPPAFPRIRGGELALVATEHLSRLDPPVSMAEAIRYLVQRAASGVAVRGEVDDEAIVVAQSARMPLLRLLNETPMQDIEQAVMRECALHQARREVMPQALSSWAAELLAGRVDTLQAVQLLAKEQGHTLATHYAVAYLSPLQSGTQGAESTMQALDEVLGQGRKIGVPMPVAVQTGQSVSVLLPPGWNVELLGGVADGRFALGIGREKPVLSAPESCDEAELAALASSMLHGGAPTRYRDLGADRLLLILYRDHPLELNTFVEETLGSLLHNDAHSATPLLPTVEAFVRHGGRLRETATELYVHRNTLAYRLDRAAEILGADLKDAGSRLAIGMALRALPLITATGTRAAGD